VPDLFALAALAALVVGLLIGLPIGLRLSVPVRRWLANRKANRDA
jgi:hypothetical protein